MRTVSGGEWGEAGRLIRMANVVNSVTAGGGRGKQSHVGYIIKVEQTRYVSYGYER